MAEDRFDRKAKRIEDTGHQMSDVERDVFGVWEQACINLYGLQPTMVIGVHANGDPGFIYPGIEPQDRKAIARSLRWAAEQIERDDVPLIERREPPP